MANGNERVYVLLAVRKRVAPSLYGIYAKKSNDEALVYSVQRFFVAVSQPYVATL